MKEKTKMHAKNVNRFYSIKQILLSVVNIAFAAVLFNLIQWQRFDMNAQF